MNGSLLLFGLCRGRQFMTGWMDSMYGFSCTTTVAAGVDSHEMGEGGAG